MTTSLLITTLTILMGGNLGLEAQDPPITATQNPAQSSTHSTTQRSHDLARFYPFETLIFAGSCGINDLDAELLSSPLGRLMSQERFQSLKSLKGLDQVRQLIRGFSGMSDSDQEAAEALVDAFASGQYGMAMGISDILIESMSPEVIGYLIVDAGEDAEKVKSRVQSVLISFIQSDPYIEKMGEERWMVLSQAGELGGIDLWWKTDEGRVVLALGEGSAKAYSDVTAGQRKSLADSPIYQAGMTNCIGEGAVTASFQFDLPAILGLVLDTMESFGEQLPPQVDGVIDQMSRIGTQHIASGVMDDEMHPFRFGWSFPFRTEGKSSNTTLKTEDFLGVPKQSYLYSVARFDANSFYQELLVFIEKLFPEEDAWQVTQSTRTFEAVLGIKIENLLEALGQRIVIFEEPKARGILPGFVAVLPECDPKVVQQAVKKLVPFIQLGLSSFGASVEPGSLSVNHGEEKLTIEYLQLRGVSVPTVLSWVELNGQILLAPNPGILEQTLFRLRQGEETGVFPDLAGASGYSRLDLGKYLEWAWPTLVPLIQTQLSGDALSSRRVQAGSLPSAHLFEGWNIEGHCFSIPEGGSMAKFKSPMPMGIEAAGGMALEGIFQGLKFFENMSMELEDSTAEGGMADPFADVETILIPEESGIPEVLEGENSEKEKAPISDVLPPR
jgi:hypothetical protein